MVHYIIPLLILVSTQIAYGAILPDGTKAPIPTILQSTNTNTVGGGNTSGGGAGASSTVFTTEQIPGASCVCAEGKDCTKPETRKYQCTVGSGLTAFQGMFREIVRWVVNIVLLLGVLAIVGAGILYMWGGSGEESAKKAKGWIINIIIGLALLFTFRYILGFLAPWIFV